MKSLTLLLLLLSTVLPGTDNTWSKVSPIYVLPEGREHLSYEYRAHFGGFTVNRGRGEILVFDGIWDNVDLYLNIYANSIYRWNVATDTITVEGICNYGGPNDSFWLMPGFYEERTPCPRHTYEGFVYVPSTDALYMTAGAYARIIAYYTSTDSSLLYAFEEDKASTWKYTFSDKTWQRIPGTAPFINVPWMMSPAHMENHMFYYPAGNKIVLANHKGDQHAEFDLDSETWTTVTTQNNAPFRFYLSAEKEWAKSTWDSKRELWIVRKGPDVCAYDPAARRYHRLPDVPSSSIRGCIAYHPGHDCYFAVGDNLNELYAYMPEDSQWITLNIPGNVPLNTMHHTLFAYDSMTDNLCLYDKSSAMTGGYYTLRYTLPVSVKKSGPSVQPDIDVRVSPNPFSPETAVNVTWRGTRTGSMTLEIFDIKGRRIKTFHASQTASVVWHAGHRPAGLYILRLTAGTRTKTVPVMLVQ